MIANLLLSALAVSAHPARRQGGAVQISSGGTQPFCLATSAAPGDGVGLQFLLCNQVQTTNPNAAGYSLWNIAPGNNPSVQLAGTNFCLDAGTNPGSNPNLGAKIWTCYPVLAQQQWYYTGDEHIAVTGYDSCLALGRYGAAYNPCGSNTGNGFDQTFPLVSPGGSAPSSSAAVSSSASVSASASSSASVSVTSSSSAPSGTPPPTNGGRVIYWQNGNDISQCLTVTNGNFYDGSPVGIAPCASLASQLWTYADNGVTSIQVAGQNYCIDFGTGGGSNGSPMKIWTCYPGLYQQTMYYTTDDHIAVYNGNQCLDQAAGTSGVQSWACSGPDVHQHWQPQN